MSGRKEPRRPRIRRTWTRNPARGAHSTTRGAKRYVRDKARDLPREEIRVSLGRRVQKRLRIAVLFSGKGEQLSDILSLIDNRALAGEIVAVISDNSSVDGIGVASDRGIRTLIRDQTNFEDKETFSKEINHILDEINIDVIVLDNFASPVSLRGRRNRHVVDSAEMLLEIAATD